MGGCCIASFYNSRDPFFKKPFGALPAGAQVRFSVRVPADYGCEEPRLVLQPDGVPLTPDGAGLLLFPMQKTGLSEEGDLFSCTLTAPAAGLYWYWFDLWVGFRKLYRGPDGEAMESTQPGRPFQLTVYDPAFHTPDDFHGGVMYQIFPDRFLEGSPGKPLPYNEAIYRRDKSKEPYFWPTEVEDGHLTRDYFGGDLAGIEKRLPFLYSLGVNWLYLNPIFEAHSNHRYNTADYLNIDPYLGTNADFERLCKTAGAFGIRIILDGVFSHTGSDSIYFNREGSYPSEGAWQDKNSPYRSWYFFKPDGSYESWWGFDTLPTVNKADPSFRKFICGAGGVIDTWLSRGAAGFRLDVADELPDDFIAEIRTAVKSHGEDKLLIGEVWEDASTKEAYGARRRYFLGGELDGVMNYPFRRAILRFLQTFDAPRFAAAVSSICENYPAPALAACTTHISTHDTVRAITALAGDPVDDHDRDWQSEHKLTREQHHLGLMRLKLAFVLQFTLPGVPCVYYGDEIAMQGYKDPFNRAYYDWTSGETGLIKLMMDLSALRKGCPAFRESPVQFTTAQGGIIAFERRAAGCAAAVAVNCSGKPAVVRLLGEEVMVPMMSHAWRVEKPPEKSLFDPLRNGGAAGLREGL